MTADSFHDVLSFKLFISVSPVSSVESDCRCNRSIVFGWHVGWIGCVVHRKSALQGQDGDIVLNDREDKFNTGYQIVREPLKQDMGPVDSVILLFP